MNTRSTQEVILSFVFVQLAILLGYKIALTWKKTDTSTLLRASIKNLILLFLVCLIAMYSYHSSKILILLTVIGSLFVFFLQKPSRSSLVKGGVFLAIASLALLFTANSAITRFESIGILASDLPKSQIFEFTTLSTGITPYIILRVIYNKVVFYGLFFLNQYFAHFSPAYFFTSGGVTDRQIIPAHGLFYLVEALLMLLGVYRFISVKKLHGLFPHWLVFLAAAPVAAALTTEAIPSSIRPFAMVLPLLFLVLLGIDWIRHLENGALKRILLLFTVGGYLWGVLYFVQQYFVVMPQYRPWHRSDDYAFTAQRVAELEEGYDRVIITDDLRELYIYLWREGRISIQQIQDQPFARYEREYQLGKYVFNQNHCDFSQATERSLVVINSECVNATSRGFTLLERMKFSDGTPAFGLYTFTVEATDSQTEVLLE